MFLQFFCFDLCFHVDVSIVATIFSRLSQLVLLPNHKPVEEFAEKSVELQSSLGRKVAVDFSSGHRGSW
jgi:hypothetical protein